MTRRTAHLALIERAAHAVERERLGVTPPPPASLLAATIAERTRLEGLITFHLATLDSWDECGARALHRLRESLLAQPLP
jgi:hypothetical protein